MSSTSAVKEVRHSSHKRATALPPRRPPRVLHIVERMGRGATEAWLLSMLEYGRRVNAPLDWSFYATESSSGGEEDRARRLGAGVRSSPVPLSDRRLFLKALRAELARGYDVIHSHHDLLSGLYFAAGPLVAAPKRVVHVHNAAESIRTPSTWKQRLYKPLLRQSCLTFADRIVGVSNHTLDTFLNGRPRRPGRDTVLYPGIEPSRFLGPAPDRKAFRRALNLADDALILLFAGRIVEEKNPLLTIRLLERLRRFDDRAVAVFAGSGGAEERVLRSAAELAVAEHVRMLGWRKDVPSIMRCADWFILPSPERPMEGFGLAVVEAQLAGLRIIVSNGVADDPFLPGASFRRLPLASSADRWARAAIELMEAPAPSASTALQELAASQMEMSRGLLNLMKLHA